MKPRVLILVALALLIAFATAHFARTWLADQRAALQAQTKVGKTVNYVLVAAKNLPTGSFVRAEDLRWQAWPDERLNDNYVTKDKDSSQALVGAVVRLRIAAGEPITDGRVIKPGDRGFLAAVLGPSMRAVSVPVTATSGVAGLVFPGDRVDLILSHSIRDPRDDKAPARNASETILGDIRVLAVDQTTNDQDNKPVLAKTVTFEVTPKEAEKIEVASELGRLSLSLRSLAQQRDEITTAALVDGDPVSHTWDSDVSPLLLRPERRPAPAGPAVVTILRGEHGNSPGQGGGGVEAAGAAASLAAGAPTPNGAN